MILLYQRFVPGAEMIKEKYWITILILAYHILTTSWISAGDLRDFTSDGCSLFPEGNLKDRRLWCDCCFSHDISYWRGGSREERDHADDLFRECVRERTHSRSLADLMYEGVRAGGHPAFHTWYRWGYGWKYGRGYAALSEQERQQAREKLDAYYKEHPLDYCNTQQKDSIPR
jgi:hypothetical protein